MRHDTGALAGHTCFYGSFYTGVRGVARGSAALYPTKATLLCQSGVVRRRLGFR